METKNVIYELRMKRGLSQNELAEKVFVTRQAVSRWENGETLPGTKIVVKLVCGVDQYPAGFSEKTGLSMLRNAA